MQFLLPHILQDSGYLYKSQKGNPTWAPQLGKKAELAGFLLCYKNYEIVVSILIWTKLHWTQSWTMFITPLCLIATYVWHNVFYIKYEEDWFVIW